MVKRLGRLLAGRDALYCYDAKPAKKFLGSGYGGWMVARDPLSSDSVALSFGVGNDISFDLELIRRYGLTVHGFDPSPGVENWIAKQILPPEYIFHAYGLGMSDGSVRFFVPDENQGMYSLSGSHKHVGNREIELPVRTLKTIAGSLGLNRIDVLKIDVEGAEYDLIPGIVDLQVPIDQLLIEFHHRAGVAPLAATVDSVKQLKAAGFLLFHVSETSSEFSFIHR
jgi:FkbM family methyltransferase